LLIDEYVKLILKTSKERKKEKMAVNYKINCNGEGYAYPHYWEYCVGSCHAATVLREDVREHIRKAHRDCGFTHLRFHGLFDDDMSVVFSPMMGMGEPIISFYNIDSIFDFLLETGMKPFVELGFMPTPLASGTQTCMHYKGNVTPPADYGKWNAFIRKFAEHLIERYGSEEVESWLFEVWNEPNLNFFFDGTQEDYFTLYENTARALKAVDEKIKVGGPATSVNAWIPEFIGYCKKNEAPLDFITTHHYPSDDPLSTMGMNGPGKKGGAMISPEMLQKIQNIAPEERQKLLEQFMNRENNNPRDILAQMTKKAKEEAGDYPLYYTEWNGSKEYDTCYQAAFAAQTLAYNHGLVEGYSFWTVSDIFEEMGMKPGPFKNEFGIQTNHGIAKPVYRLFQALHEAGDIRLQAEGSHERAEVLVLKKDREIMVFAYNHDLDRRNVQKEEMEITLEGSVKTIKKAVIDEEHCNPLKAWKEMGSPEYLKREHLEVLEKASELVYEEVILQDTGNQTICFTAEPESVTIFKVVMDD